VHIPDPNTAPWGVFEELKGQKFYKFNEVRDKISELTDKVAGRNKGIVDKPIILTVYSPTCPDLTLIDLPGACPYYINKFRDYKNSSAGIRSAS
jgi:vacuolar protein sorting-associated protein 1